MFQIRVRGLATAKVVQQKTATVFAQHSDEILGIGQRGECGVLSDLENYFAGGELALGELFQYVDEGVFLADGFLRQFDGNSAHAGQLAFVVGHPGERGSYHPAVDIDDLVVDFRRLDELARQGEFIVFVHDPEKDLVVRLVGVVLGDGENF